MLEAVGNDWPSRWVAPINAVRRGMTGKNLLFWAPISLWCDGSKFLKLLWLPAGWMYASSNGLRVVGEIDQANLLRRAWKISA